MLVEEILWYFNGGTSEVPLFFWSRHLLFLCLGKRRDRITPFHVTFDELKGTNIVEKPGLSLAATLKTQRYTLTYYTYLIVERRVLQFLVRQNLNSNCQDVVK